MSGATRAQSKLSDKGSVFKGLVVCNSRDLDSWDLLYDFALGCHLRFELNRINLEF